MWATMRSAEEKDAKSAVARARRRRVGRLMVQGLAEEKGQKARLRGEQAGSTGTACWGLLLEDRMCSSGSHPHGNLQFTGSLSLRFSLRTAHCALAQPERSSLLLCRH